MCSPSFSPMRVLSVRYSHFCCKHPLGSLLRRYTSLRPLQPALWQAALESLASSDQTDSMGKWLQPQGGRPQSRAERAATLLGNLVEAAGPSMQVSIESCFTQAGPVSSTLLLDL